MISVTFNRFDSGDLFWPLLIYNVDNNLQDVVKDEKENLKK